MGLLATQDCGGRARISRRFRRTISSGIYSASRARRKASYHYGRPLAQMSPRRVFDHRGFSHPKPKSPTLITSRGTNNGSSLCGRGRRDRARQNVWMPCPRARSVCVNILISCSREGQRLPRRAGRPKIAEIARACAMNRNALYVNPPVAKILKEFDERERAGSPCEDVMGVLRTYLKQLQETNCQLPRYGGRAEQARYCASLRDPARCLQISECSTTRE